jgi:hypothetical protein
VLENCLTPPTLSETGFTQPSATCKLLNEWDNYTLKRLASAEIGRVQMGGRKRVSNEIRLLISGMVEAIQAHRAFTASY